MFALTHAHRLRLGFALGLAVLQGAGHPGLAYGSWRAAANTSGLPAVLRLSQETRR